MVESQCRVLRCRVSGVSGFGCRVSRTGPADAASRRAILTYPKERERRGRAQGDRETTERPCASIRGKYSRPGGCRRMNLFAVIRSRGGAWHPSLPLEQQADWDAHAAFMNALASEGFVLLGGPLEGTPEVLLIVRARSSDEIADRLQADPWTEQGLLHLTQITPWTLRLGALP